MTCSRQSRSAAASAFLVACLGAVASAAGGESRIYTVATSSTWAAIACREQLFSRVCEIEKDYEDPGLLPSIVSVGDVLQYRNRRGQEVKFRVRAISLYVLDRDMDPSGSRLGITGKKGETLCALFDTASRERIARGYASRIMIKECRGAHV